VREWRESRKKRREGVAGRRVGAGKWRCSRFECITCGILSTGSPDPNQAWRMAVRA
jgi:hypothetical protein